MGKDYTLFAVSDGTVQFKIARGKKVVEVV